MTTEAAKPKSRIWLRLLLGLSLALNLLVVGIVAGWMVSKGPGRTPDDVNRTARSLGLEPFVRALAPMDRVALVRSAREERDGLRENRRALRARFERLVDAIRAEPYDPAAVRAVLEEQRGSIKERQEIGERLLLERLDAMTPEDRATYAERLEEELKRGPSRKR